MKLFDWFKKQFEYKPRCFFCNRVKELKTVQITLDRDGGVDDIDICIDEQNCWENS